VVDAQANIKVSVDTGQALAELKALEKQIQVFNKGIVQGTAEASKFQNQFATSLIHNINATGKFTASMGTVHTETEKFANALEKNQLSAREYFRYSMASTKTFGKLFGKEFKTITKTAEERVKLLQTRHIELGRAADGAMRAVKIVPTSLDYKQPITQMQMAIQKQQIFNQLLDTGTTKLLNFGKNTQWAGRQLMVGFTIPLTILGGAAIKTFRTMEEQAIRFKKVYGDMFTGQAETDRALEKIQQLGQEFTKYGKTVADTIKLAADAAAAGNSGKQLENIVEQTTKLAVLGDLTSEQAFDATIAIQNAFRLTGKELSDAVNFLNAVENQTVVALEDITEAIPRVASVVSVLGGDIKDLAVFMAAMKEGGIQASDGANALKTSLGRLINPTKAAVQMSADLGINLRAIVDENAGDLSTIMLTFAEALKPLDDLSKARLMEKVFGKFQFARMTTLFNNLGRSGTQAARAMQLAGQSTESLAMLAEKELGVVADSAATKFAASMEKLKVSLAPLGEELIKLITPVADFFTKLLGKFNDLSDGTKKVITGILVGLGAIGPVVLMGIGLFANGIANLLKFINLLRKSYQSLTMGGQALGMSTNYLSVQQLEALSVANNLHSVHERLTDRFALEAGALSVLSAKYREATMAASGFLSATGTRGMFVPGTRGRFGAAAPRLGPPRIPMADGGIVPGTGNKDTVPAMLMPGEFVVTKKATQANAQVLKEMNAGNTKFRRTGTPGSAKVAYRSNGTGKNTGTQTTQGTRALAHVGVRTTISNNEVKELLRLDANDKQKLGGVARERLQLLDKSQNLTEQVKLSTSELRRIAKDVTDTKTIKASQIDAMERNELKRTIATNSTYAKLTNDKQILSTYGKKVNGYTSQVVDMDNKIQSGMTARGKNPLPTTTRAEIVKDIKSNRFTFALGLQQGVLDNLVDDNGKPLTQKEKTEISRNIAKKTERALVRGFGANKIVPEADFTKIYNQAEQATLDEKFKNKSITFKNKLKADLDKYRKTTTSLRVAGKDVSSLYSKGTGPLSYKQFDDAKTYRQRVFANLNKVDRFNDYVAKRTAVVSSKVPSRVAKHSAKVGRFGAAAGLATATGLFGIGAAQAFQNRSLGTPAYGEQRATQAMLTPGEFVVGANATQKFGPALQAMNQGEVVKRVDGTPEQKALAKQVEQMKIKNPGLTTQQALRQLQSKEIAQMKASNPTLTTPQAMKEIKKLKDELKKNTQGVNKSTKVYSQEVKDRAKNIKRADKANQKAIQTNKMNAMRAKVVPKLSGIGMGAFIASGALQAASAKTDDPKKAENLQTAGNVLMGLGSLAMILPMLSSTTAMIGIVAAAMAGSFYLLNRELNKAAKEGREIASRVIVTAEEIKKMEEVTGNFSAGSLADRMRSTRTEAINPIKSEFGDDFIESDFGKEFMEQIGKSGADSAGLIANKLATFIQQGLIDVAEAQSIAEAIGRSLNDRTFTIKVNAELQSLIGINGRDLFKDPAEVAVRILEDSRQNAIKQIQDLQEIEAKAYDSTNSLARRGAGRSTGGTEANVIGTIAAAAGAGAGVGAGIGAIATAPTGPGAALGAGIGAVVGAVAGGVIGWQAYGKAQLEAAKTTKVLTAATVGLNVAFINQSQEILDGYDIQHINMLENLDNLEEEALRRKTIVKSAEDLALVDEVLLNIANKRNKVESEYAQGRLDIIAQQSAAYKETMEMFSNFKLNVQEVMIDETKTGLKEKFKGTAQAPLAAALGVQTDELEDKALTYTINTAVLSGTLGLENAVNMLTLFGKDEEKLSKTFELFLETKGVGEFDRVLTALSRMQEGEQKDKIITSLGNVSAENFQTILPFLEMLNKLPSSVENVGEALKGLSLSELIGAGNDLKNMSAFVEDLAEIKDKDLQKKFVLDFVSDKPEFQQIADNIDYFLSLDDENKKIFTSVFTSIVNLITPEDIAEEQARMQAEVNNRGFGQFVVSQAQALRKLHMAARKEAERYTSEGDLYQLPALEEPEPEPGGGGSKSRAMTIQQLIELRLKGLDPAAAASLDYAQAAEILNSSVRKQKNSIRDLNAELRIQAITANLLKSDQEVLGDTLKATTSAIGAYINMIEQTRIKPIQDQIDAFNKLNEAQSEQIEKYQKGLQSLSDKEDKINKIYDERIEAIDKVSDANERSAQRSQRQIGLASALASGDIAAAASAAADITSAEAEYRLEDARAALEERRQQELKNLTIEINGELFTREQIETNIKNLEEEIYQRGLLIKENQKEIAEIEKEITAQKEKQRKIQALQQIMAISQQLKTTVDPQQRQLMIAEMGFIGQSVGVSDLSNQGQFTQLGQELGVDLTGFTSMIATSIQLSEQAALEMALSANEVKKKSKNIAKFMNDGSLAAGNALGFLQTLNNGWSDKKTGLTAQGTSVRDSMISAANSLVQGKNILDNTIKDGLKAIGAAATAAAKSIISGEKKANLGGLIERPLGGLIPYMGGGKVLERPLGGLIPYMGGGRVKKYAMGGNVNYKGSRESAPVKMNLGSMVTGSVAPGLGNLDRVPALLTPGEFVVRKSVAQENMPFLRALNKDIFPKFDSGMDAGSISPVSVTSVTGDTNLYNSYSVNVNVPNTNASPEEIANVVMSKIQRSSMSTIRTTRR
jgi:TP901 family phage tail tape measure protein